MILMDYSQLVIAAAFQFKRDLKKLDDSQERFGLLRHSLLSTVLAYKRDYGGTYGEIVFAVDRAPYWRRELFPPYKALRAAQRANSDIDWVVIHEFKQQMLQDLVEVFPYRVVDVPRAEADDVIAVLTRECQERFAVQEGFATEPQPVLILSSDGDFKQLHKFRGVKQYNPILKKMVEKPADDFLLQKIIEGDRGDGIPSILMPDNSIVEGIRAKPVNAKVRERAVRGELNEEETRNLSRNRRLIDFDFIPDDVCEAIISNYESQAPARDLQKIMAYLSKHRCRILLESLQSF